jgi:FKBP-type peptidyl-prolyl cis-trans isomerase FklB
MKKILTIALALVVSASFSTVSAAKKKKDKKDAKTEVVKAPVKLLSGSDTLSYTTGMAVTNGLISYMQSQLGVDTAYMADFIAGFEEAVKGLNDPRQKARIAGFSIADQVGGRMLSSLRQEADGPDSICEEMFFRGFTDALLGDTTVMTVNKAETLSREKIDANRQAKFAEQVAKGRAFLEENAKKEGVISLPSGLQYKVLKQGDGVVPQTTDKVKVHYEGRLIDGTVFDASSKHGTEPATFRPDQVIKGWTEALTMMPVGSKWQLFIPQELGYGERAAGQIPPCSTLIFDVELVGIDK